MTRLIAAGYPDAEYTLAAISSWSLLRVRFGDLVNGADVGMVERRGGSGLAPKPLQRLRIFGQRFWKEFGRDVAAEVQILSLINHTHSSAAVFLNDAVVRNGL